MNKKEVAEIKKQFTPDRCAITRICGCYVNAEKEKQLEMKVNLQLWVKVRPDWRNSASALKEFGFTPDF